MADENQQTEASTQESRGELSNEEENQRHLRRALAAEQKQARQKPAQPPPSAKATEKAAKAQKKQSGRQAKAVVKYDPAKFMVAAGVAAGYEIFVLLLTLISGGLASLIEWVGDLTLGTVLVLFLWSQGGSRDKTKIIQRFIVTFGIESVPYLDILPMWTLTILWTWYDVWRKT